MAVAGTAAVRGRSLPSLFGGRTREQLETLQSIVTKHVEDPGLRDIASTDDFAVTAAERGVTHWEHGHLVAALDTLNAYQRDRRASSGAHVFGQRAHMRRAYKHDPRTRFVELLKRWLRNNASNTNLTEDEVRRMSALCRDIMNHPNLFPARNGRSFMKTIAEAYQHLEVQLQEVLERDRTCAELAQRVLSLSRNLVSDAIGYLLVGPTDLRKTDELPSLEAVSLWASLPTEAHPLPARIDAKMQRVARDVWPTHCGALIASLLRTPWCVRLFEGAGAQEEAAAHAAALPDAHCGGAEGARHASAPEMAALIEKIRGEFDGGSLKNSGLAGSFRKAERHGVRMNYLAAVEVLVDVVYLVGEALVQFHRISDGLGDYGMIRVATWLHPFLEAFTEKILRLKGCLEGLNRAVDEHLILASAKGYSVEKPAPSQRMGQRAHLAIQRAVINSDCHVQNLLRAVEDLRQRSSPDRLPSVIAGIGDACTQLDAVLSSPEFRACVGDHFQALPRLADAALGQPRSQMQLENQSQPRIVDVTEDVDDEAGNNITSEDMHDLRSIAAPQHAPPRFDDLDLLTTAEPAVVNLQNGGPDEEVYSGPSEADARRIAWKKFCAATAASSPLGSAKASAEKAEWPLHIDRGTADYAEPLLAHVWRLMPVLCGTGVRRHDRRGLRLDAGRLDVFEKGSALHVKTSLDLRRGDVDECSLLPGGRRLSVTICRALTGAAQDSGVCKTKTYFFEFESADLASSFHAAISDACR